MLTLNIPSTEIRIRSRSFSSNDGKSNSVLSGLWNGHFRESDYKVSKDSTFCKEFYLSPLTNSLFYSSYQTLFALYCRSVVVIKVGNFTEFGLVYDRSTSHDDDILQMNFSMRDVNYNTLFERQYVLRFGKQVSRRWFSSLTIFEQCLNRITYIS